MRLWFSFTFLCFAQLLVSYAVAQTDQRDKTLKIYLDADRSRLRTSAMSIEMGIRTAFAEVHNRIQGRDVEFVTLDHRGNTTRSKLNMDTAFADPDTLFVLAGLHSPPLIKNRTYINENKMLTAVAWAAGGPVTRYADGENWVFRLSVDDTKAGIRIANYAVHTRDCKTPHLLLEQTPWGESNRKTMNKSVSQLLNIQPQLTWYSWGVPLDSARIKLRAIKENGADCILYVGNAIDGEVFTRAMLSMDENKRIPIFSHWGITGGNFPENIGSEPLTSVDITFIQTCFSFVSSEPTPFSKKVFSLVQTLYPQVKNPADLKAPVGAIHAYDMGRIIIQALSQITLSDDMVSNRSRLREALENLEAPVEGLVKRYERPFSPFSIDNDSAHEALGLEDFCMAKFGPENEIIVLPKS